MNNKLALFEEKEIRKTWENNKWYFSIVDVVYALTVSSDPKQYVNKLKYRDEELKKGWVQIVHTLRMDTKGGKQKVICADTEGILRIIQSIPSPKAEPFKRWLAKVGAERIEEINNPELALTNLGEATAVEFHRENDSKGLSQLKSDMNKAGKVLNKAKKEIENELRRPIVTTDNFIDLTSDYILIENK